MLAIRMQRTGRKGHAMFRVVVQDSRRTPTSGKVVAQIGSYDPHAKTTTLQKDKASYYLEHGAQPSDRVVGLFEREGVKLPNWVKKPSDKKGPIRNLEKLRKNRPAEEAKPAIEAEQEASAAAADATEDESATTPVDEASAPAEASASEAAPEAEPAVEESKE